MRVNRARRRLSRRGVLRRLAARETRNPFPRTFLSPSLRARSVKIFFGRCERAQSTIIESHDGVPRCVKMGDNERGGGLSFRGIAVETSSQHLALHNETLVATRAEVECRFAPRRDFHSRFRSLAEYPRSTSRAFVHFPLAFFPGLRSIDRALITGSHCYVTFLRRPFGASFLEPRRERKVHARAIFGRHCDNFRNVLAYSVIPYSVCLRTSRSAYSVNGHSWRALLRNTWRSPAWNIVSSTPLVPYRARVCILQSLIARHDQAQRERKDEGRRGVTGDEFALAAAV